MKRGGGLNFLGIDLGTSAVKVVIMNELGNILAKNSKSYPVDYPRNNWAEQNPEDWWIATKEAIRELILKNNIQNDSIKAVSFSGQMHGLVALDENNRVLMPAILWCDQRTKEECDEIIKLLGQDKLTKYTGNEALTGFTAPKILWVKKHRPEIYEKIAKILLPKDYLRLKLTGDFATDVSDASGTLLFDVENRIWSKPMLESLEISETILPEVFESFEVTGKLTEEAKKELNLDGDILVIAGAGDQAAGGIGTGVVKDGIISVALGTSGVVFASQDKYVVDKKNRLHAFCHANKKWHSMGVMLSAASSLKWWVENINKDTKQPFDKLLSEAEKASTGSSGLIFLPYLMGERTPHNDPYARGCFIGLTMSHGRAEMTRSILEGVAFGLNDSLEIIRELNIPINEVRVSGGGIKSLLWLQILADIFDMRVSLLNSSEGPAFGAAILAAVGMGIFDSVDEACEKLIHVTNTIEPIYENVSIYKKLYIQYKALYNDLSYRFKAISQVVY